MVITLRYRRRSLSLLADGEALCRRAGVGHGAGNRLLPGAPTTGQQNQAARTQRLVVVRSGNPDDPGSGGAGDNRRA